MQKLISITDFKTIEDLIPYNLEILKKMRSKVAKKYFLKHQKKLKKKQSNTLKKDCTVNTQ